MSIETTDALEGLLAILDGSDSARWNFYDAVGTSVSSPGGLGNAAAVSFGFLAEVPDYYSTAGFLPFSTAQQDAAREVLEVYSSLIRMDFVETDSLDEITFGMDAQGSGSSGYAYYPAFGYSFRDDTILSVTALEEAGDVWINSESDWTEADFELGGQGYGTLVHELGHALGLKHPFESQPGGFVLSPELDNQAYTVMSYTTHPHGLFRTVTETAPKQYQSTYTYIDPETPMLLDIVALQHLYGANLNTNTGDDVYTFDTERPFIKTLWDAGGKDTLSVSNFSNDCVIDLQEGAFSSIRILSDALPDGAVEEYEDVYDGTDNLAIAYGTVIENAVGGLGNDHMTGNAAANNLSGMAGNDTLSGGAGIDRLDGGAGQDSLIGGAGNDVYVVNVSKDVIAEMSKAGVDLVESTATFVLPSNVENLTLKGGAVVNGTGNTLNNTLTGNTGANALKGLAGNDVIRGKGGKDMLTGGTGSDRFIFDTKPGTSNIDSVLDLAHGIDKLALDDDIFKAFNAKVSTLLAAGQFRSAKGAVSAADADDRIIYNPTTGALFYDADGVGGVAATKFAILGSSSGHPAITVEDFLIVA